MPAGGGGQADVEPCVGSSLCVRILRYPTTTTCSNLNDPLTRITHKTTIILRLHEPRVQVNTFSERVWRICLPWYLLRPHVYFNILKSRQEPWRAFKDPYYRQTMLTSRYSPIIL